MKRFLVAYDYGLGAGRAFVAAPKLNAARRALGGETETEAIDLALDLVSFRREVADGITAMRRVGGIEDVVEPRRRR